MARMPMRLDPTKTGVTAEELRRNLRRQIIGQDEAIQAIASSYQMHLTGMHGVGRPIASFLFLGPTGSGKTRIVEATAECLLGDSRAVVKVDCGEFQHSHEIAKLIGAPPGYLGHRHTSAILSQEALEQCFTRTVRISFVLFDEIEKASDALWNLLLGILDKGTLTLGDNRRVDFSRAMIFLTSNLGGAEIRDLLAPKFGFQQQAQPGGGTGRLEEKISRTAEEAARRKFTPEFINRLDKIVTFKPLGASQLRQILDIELRMVQARIFKSGPERSFVFTASDHAKELLLREGTDQNSGARHLKRAVERLLVQPMSNLIATQQARGGDCIRVDLDQSQGRLHFVREMEGLGSYMMTELVGVKLPAKTISIGQSAPLETPKTWKTSFFK